MNKKLISGICVSALVLLMSVPISAKGATSLLSTRRIPTGSSVISTGTRIIPTGSSVISGKTTTSVSVPSSLSGKVNLVRTSYQSSVPFGKVRLNSSSRIVLNMPNNSRKDLMQGTITLTPVGGGSSKSYDFMNFYNENWTINLSEISSGEYYATLKPTVYGTSNKATLYYNIG